LPYPPDLAHRFRADLTGLFARVLKLETRTAGIDSGMPLAALPAQIDPSYTSGDPMAYINGSPTLTGPYQTLASYTPAASDQVIALPLPVTAGVAPGTYVILGKLT
jgi:hypothetical protein